MTLQVTELRMDFIYLCLGSFDEKNSELNKIKEKNSKIYKALNK